MISDKQDIEHILDLNLSFIEKRSYLSLDFIKHQKKNIIKLIGNKEFFDELARIIFLFLDADKNGEINENDIKLIKKSFNRNGTIRLVNLITNLTEALLILIAKYDKPQLKFDKKALEDIVMGTLIYVIFQYLPSNEQDEYYAIVEMIINMYLTLKSVDRMTGMVSNVTNALRDNAGCWCFKKKCDIESLLQRDMENIRGYGKELKDNGHMIIRMEELERLNRDNVTRSEVHDFVEDIYML